MKAVLSELQKVTYEPEEFEVDPIPLPLLTLLQVEDISEIYNKWVMEEETLTAEEQETLDAHKKMLDEKMSQFSSKKLMRPFHYFMIRANDPSNPHTKEVM